MTVHELPALSPIHGRPCWVRVTRRRADGFVEFDFSIGDPDLAVDLILPAAAFEEFCRVNRARHLSDEQGRRLDREQSKWRYGTPGVDA